MTHPARFRAVRVSAFNAAATKFISPPHHRPDEVGEEEKEKEGHTGDSSDCF